MSWETFNYDETATCRCGKGTVVKHCYIKDDDWNRIKHGYTHIDILCEDCKSKYHIETIFENHYLAPNDITLKNKDDNHVTENLPKLYKLNFSQNNKDNNTI